MKGIHRLIFLGLALIPFLLSSGCSKSIHQTRVTTNPTGALLFYNGKIVGETPCEVIMHQRKGDYNIYTFRAVKDDYMPHSQAYKEQMYYETVADVVPAIIHYELRKRKIFEIYITSEPTGAVILLNGEVAGETPFTERIKERIGDYRQFDFVAKKDGYKLEQKELREFPPQENGAIFEFPETIHFALEK